jgi:type VI protein secretion system component Hcp
MKGRILSVLAGCCTALAPLGAAIDIVANFPGSSLNATGDYPHDPYENWLELESAGWGLSMPASGTGTAVLGGIGFNGEMTRATPEMLSLLARGRVLPKMEVGFLTPGRSGEQPVPVMEMELENVLFTSLSLSAGAGDDRVGESFSVAAATLFLKVHQIGDTGSPPPSEEVYWNFITQSTDPLNPDNAPPVISNPGNVLMQEDGSVTLAFTVSDAESAAGLLSVTRGTDNPLLLPPDGILLGGSGENRTVTLQPAADRSGVANITLEVSDGHKSAQTTFQVTVEAVNDAPVVSVVTTVITDQDTAVEVPFTVNDVDTDSASVVVEAGSSDPLLLPPGAFSISGAGVDRMLAITPASGLHGAATVTLRAFDGAAFSADASFTLFVNEAVGPVDFGLSASAVAENSPEGVVIGTFSPQNPDPAESYGYALVDDAGGRFVLGGPGNATLQVAAAANLDHEAAAEHLIAVRMTGSLGADITRDFTLSVLNLNERPTVALPPLEAVSPFAPERALYGIELDDPDGDEPSATVTFAVSTGRLYLNPTTALAGAIAGNDSPSVMLTASLADIRAALAGGALSYIGDFSGASEATLTVAVSDNGSGGLGGSLNASASRAFPLATAAWQWLNLHFTGAQLADPEVVGLAADFDRDGYGLLMEYALGMDPTRGDPPPVLELGELEVDGQRFVTVTFHRIPESADPLLSVSVEVASDSFAWQSGPAFITPLGAGTVQASGLEAFSVRSALPIGGGGASSQLFRLRFRFSGN